MNTIQLSPTEHGYIQSQNQRNRKYLWIYKPPVVFQCQVNQSFSTLDMVLQVIYDNVTSGAYTDVIPGMTVLVGSAAGLDDLGFVRARKAPTSNTLYIGEVSDVLWANDVWLTVIDDFGLWPRILRTSSDGTAKMDGDLTYSDQHANWNPAPVLGAHACVWLDPDTGEAVVPFDASDSWVLGSSISAYLWSASAGTLSNTAIANPNLTVNAAGMIRVGCQVTAANGKATTGYRRVFVFDADNPPITDFQLRDCSGSWSRGDWQFRVTMKDAAHIDNVVDRALCILFTIDYYGSTQASVGHQVGRANIKAVGWIEGQSIRYGAGIGSVTFLVTGPRTWLDKITGFPIGVRESNATPAAWTDIQTLTVDKALFHLLYWQSTVIPTIDVFLTGDTRNAVELSAPGESSLLGQINALAEQTTYMRALSDRFATLSIEIDTQIMPAGSRPSAVMTLEKKDWVDEIGMERHKVNRTSRVNLSGILATPGQEARALFSLAPGHIFTLHGRPSTNDRLLLSSQAQANALAAMVMARDNHLYDFEIDLRGHNLMVDIIKSQHLVTVAVGADDNPRGIAYAGNILVREIQMSDNDNGDFLEISWFAESENDPSSVNSADGDIPFEDGSIDLPEFPDIDLPPLPPLPPPIDPTPDGSLINNVVMIVNGKGIFYTKNFSSSSPSWYAMNAGLDDPAGEFFWTIEVTSSGRLYLLSGTSIIYTAPYLGGRWTKVITAAQIQAMLPNPFGFDGHINALGINRGAEDEGMILAGVGATAFAYHSYFKLTSNGVEIATRYDIAPSFPVLQAQGYMYFGANKWISMVPSWNKVVCVANREASAVLLQSDQGNGGAVPAFMIRNSKDGQAAFLWNAPNADQIRYTLDNGASFVDCAVQEPYSEFWSNLQSVGADPTGTYLMLGDAAGILTKKSSDSGATWGNVTGLSGTTKCVWNMGSANHWIIAFAGQPYFTGDFGATWESKVGDLWQWTGSFPAPNIAAIRSF